MKRIFAIILAALTVLCLASCTGESSATPTQKATETVAVTEVTEEPTEAPTEAPTAETQPDDKERLSAFISAFDRDAQIEENLIYEEEGVSITAKSLAYDPVRGAQLKLSVQNDTERDLLIQPAYTAINGYMVRPEMNIEIPAGKTAEGEMTVAYYQLAMADINMIARITASVRLMDKRKYEVITVSEPVEIETSAAESYEVVCDEEGQVVYDKKDIKIILKGISDDRLFADDPVMIVYLYNGTDQKIAIQTEEVTVNGYDFTSAMTTTLLPGMRAVDIVTFFSKDMEEYGVDEIESVKVSFEIKDEESWENIAKTKTIQVELGE